MAEDVTRSVMRESMALWKTALKTKPE